MKRTYIYIILAWLIIPFSGNTQCSCDSLVSAIQRQDTLSIASCLASGTDPNCKVSEYEHRIMRGALQVRSTEYVFHWFFRPMTYAIRVNSLPIVKQLQRAGASINSGGVSIRDTLYKQETPLFYEVPLHTAEKVKEKQYDSAIYKYLRSEGALTFEEQYKRGQRASALMFRGVASPWGRNNSMDSVLVLQQMLEAHGDGIIFEGQDFIFEKSLYYNIPLVYNWMLNTKKVQYWEFVNDSIINYRSTHYIYSLFIGNNRMTVETIDSLKKHRIIDDKTLVRHLRFLKPENRDLYRYYKGYFKNIEFTEDNLRRRFRLKRMDKLKRKIAEENTFPNRLKEDFN